MIKSMVWVILMCVLCGCALQDARTALTAQRSLIGWSEVDLESCLGAPDQHSTFGDTDILTYIGNSTSNKGVNLIGVVTLSGGGYCHATFTVKDGRVVEVHYTGETNAMLAPEAYCAPIVRGCVHQSGPTGDLTPVGGPTFQREMDDCKGKMVAGAGGR